MDIERFVIPKKHFQDVNDRVIYNDSVAVLYDRFFDEQEGQRYIDWSFHYRASSLRACGQFWKLNYYRLQQVKDIQSVGCCRDKFCFNCQVYLASQRLAKYSSILDELSERYTICHVVVSVPNSVPEALLPLLDKMYDKFKHLTRFFSGNAKIKDIDFSKYGYAGAVRSLEVSVNEFERTFHPHFHCIFLFRKGIRFEGKNPNVFSYDKYHMKKYRYFSDFEILLQKVWYLLMNDIPVTKKAIEDLQEGYSVYCERAKKGKYHEVFKYACKGAFKKGVGMILEPEDFCYLFKALHNRRMIQGYGLLHNFKDEEGELIEQESIELYNEFIKKLSKFENPVSVCEKLKEILSEENCRYISKSNFRRLFYYMQRMEKEK